MLKRKYVVTALLVAVVAAVILQFTYPGGVVGSFMDLGMKMTSGMKQRDVGAEAAAFTLKADELTQAFKSDTAAMTKYIDQAVLVEGTISAINGNVVNMGNISCSMDSSGLTKLASLQAGAVAKIQGRLTTYNDLLEEIQMDKCVIK
jgi:hypothetical protein